MTKPVEITREQLALILEALDDAAYYRDARSRVLKSAMRKRSGRSITTDVVGAAGDVHQRQAQAYGALAIKLKHEL